MKTSEKTKRDMANCAKRVSEVIECFCEAGELVGCAQDARYELIGGISCIRQLEKEIKQKDERIRQLEQRVPRWISVKERLPEHWHMDDKDRTLINYLVYSPDYGVDVGNYIKSAKRWVCMGLPMNVTHWMPLPEPPEEGES